jgi:hypothetical protein
LKPTKREARIVQEGKLIEVTPEFCGKLFSAGSEDYDIWTRALTPENIKRLQAAKKLGPGGGDVDIEDIVSALLSQAEQRAFCHQYDQALADLDLWPESSRDEMKDNFAESIKTYSPEFAARLAGGSTSK